MSSVGGSLVSIFIIIVEPEYLGQVWRHQAHPHVQVLLLVAILLSNTHITAFWQPEQCHMVFKLGVNSRHWFINLSAFNLKAISLKLLWRSPIQWFWRQYAKLNSCFFFWWIWRQWAIVNVYVMNLKLESTNIVLVYICVGRPICRGQTNSWW